MAACLAQSERNTKQINIFVLSGQKLQLRIDKFIPLYQTQTPGIKKEVNFKYFDTVYNYIMNKIKHSNVNK